jgi:hypothetical protein
LPSFDRIALHGFDAVIRDLPFIDISNTIRLIGPLSTVSQFQDLLAKAAAYEFEFLLICRSALLFSREVAPF